MKLVLLSIVVVPFASSGKLITVAAAPTESAKRHDGAAVKSYGLRVQRSGPNQHCAPPTRSFPGFGECHALQLGKRPFSSN